MGRLIPCCLWVLREVREPSILRHASNLPFIHLGPSQLYISAFPISAQNVMLSEDKEGEMAGSGMPLNINRWAGLRQVAILLLK